MFLVNKLSQLALSKAENEHGNAPENIALEVTEPKLTQIRNATVEDPGLQFRK